MEDEQILNMYTYPVLALKKLGGKRIQISIDIAFYGQLLEHAY